MKKAKLFFALVLTLSLLTVNIFADVIKKDSTGDEVKEVQEMLIKAGYLNGFATGYFGVETEKAVKAFQAKNGIEADGIIGSKTFAILLETTGKGIETEVKAASKVGPNGVELLDWWTEVSKIFKIGKVATVTDVDTGITFKIVRTYGVNHADSEALTAEDAKAMKKIWGGDWSWERRAVVVEIDNRKIAASIAAMPHAGVDSKQASTTVANRSAGYGRGNNLDKIKNNGMSGVVDVHFLNSRTHATNRVDKLHQAAIKKAAGIK